MLCIINCQNVVIKYNTRLTTNTYNKNIKIKILYKTLERMLTAKIANIKNCYLFIFLSFLYIKGLNINMSLISSEGYKNAKVSHLKIEEAGELWASIKDVGDGLGVKIYLT